MDVVVAMIARRPEPGFIEHGVHQVIHDEADVGFGGGFEFLLQ